jgi:hypothetical protein
VARKGRARRFREARELKQGYDDGLFREGSGTLADAELDGDDDDRADDDEWDDDAKWQEEDPLDDDPLRDDPLGEDDRRRAS